jgi:hypothetical protein
MSVRSGFIYVLTHPSDPDLVKIGMSTRHPEKRIKEHNTCFTTTTGKIVKETGQKWILKDFFPVTDTYNAESAFWHRSPLTEIPHAMGDELIRMDDKYLNWEWIEEGIQAAKHAGIRDDINQPPIPKPNAKRNKEWMENQIKDSGLTMLTKYRGLVTGVEFKCSKGHTFKKSAGVIAYNPNCPLCKPECF